MKYKVIVLSLAIATTLNSFAETPFEREFNQLRDQRARAAAAALDPINRRYQASLDQLLRRATQGNDLDTAIKLKAEIQSLAAAAPTTVSSATSTDSVSATEQKKRLRDFLMQSQWKFGKHTLTFEKNDSASCSDGSTWSYKLKAPNVLILQGTEVQVTLDAERIELPKFAPDGGDRTLVRLPKP